LNCKKEIDRIYSTSEKEEFACDIWYNTLRINFLREAPPERKEEWVRIATPFDKGNLKRK
ncbi:MAG: hypothetical protein CMD85_05750, partial [Gammaproteobacteria bacterium]|nr:hypothetical protein [Gammaproteobacteria bacterium]